METLALRSSDLMAIAGLVVAVTFPLAGVVFWGLSNRIKRMEDALDRMNGVCGRLERLEGKVFPD